MLTSIESYQKQCEMSDYHELLDYNIRVIVCNSDACCISLTNFEYEVQTKKNSPNYQSNSLTNLGYEVNKMTGNGNYVNLLKFAYKKS